MPKSTLSRVSQALTALFMLATLSSCGGVLTNNKTGSTMMRSPTRKTKAPAKAKDSPLLQINDVWRITSKTCNGAPVAPVNGEGIMLDGAQLIRLAYDGTTPNEICKIAFKYTRGIQISASPTKTSYNESSIADSSLMIRACYRSPGGHPVEPPISTENGAFGPEEFQMTLALDGNRLALTMVAPVDCPAGNLVYNLVRR